MLLHFSPLYFLLRCFSPRAQHLLPPQCFRPSSFFLLFLTPPPPWSTPSAVFRDVGIGANGIIDGDALLQHCLQSNLLDPELPAAGTVAAGGDAGSAGVSGKRLDQLLPVACLFQSFLSKMAACRANIVVVFFESRLPHWQGFGRAIRLALPAHLEQTLKWHREDGHGAKIRIERSITDFSDGRFKALAASFPYTYLLTAVADPAMHPTATSDASTATPPAAASAYAGPGLAASINAFAAYSQMDCTTLVLLRGHTFKGGSDFRAWIIWETTKKSSLGNVQAEEIDASRRALAELRQHGTAVLETVAFDLSDVEPLTKSRLLLDAVRVYRAMFTVAVGDGGAALLPRHEAALLELVEQQAALLPAFPVTAGRRAFVLPAGAVEHAAAGSLLGAIPAFWKQFLEAVSVRLLGLSRDDEAAVDCNDDLVDFLDLRFLTALAISRCCDGGDGDAEAQRVAALVGEIESHIASASTVTLQAVNQDLLDTQFIQATLDADIIDQYRIAPQKPAAPAAATASPSDGALQHPVPPATLGHSVQQHAANESGGTAPAAQAEGGIVIDSELAGATASTHIDGVNALAAEAVLNADLDAAGTHRQHTPAQQQPGSWGSHSQQPCAGRALYRMNQHWASTGYLHNEPDPIMLGKTTVLSGEGAAGTEAAVARNARALQKRHNDLAKARHREAESLKGISGGLLEPVTIEERTPEEAEAKRRAHANEGGLKGMLMNLRVQLEQHDTTVSTFDGKAQGSVSFDCDGVPVPDSKANHGMRDTSASFSAIIRLSNAISAAGKAVLAVNKKAREKKQPALGNESIVQVHAGLMRDAKPLLCKCLEVCAAHMSDRVSHAPGTTLSEFAVGLKLRALLNMDQMFTDAAAVLGIAPTPASPPASPPTPTQSFATAITSRKRRAKIFGRFVAALSSLGLHQQAEFYAATFGVPAPRAAGTAGTAAAAAAASPQMQAAALQLKCMPALLDRPTGEADSRVIWNFNPDPWQVSLMDAVDRRQSALVNAPTSSGKTFISFYAMEQVLRHDSTGLIVYVCPTKALVNQVRADIYARFSKSYTGSNAGMTLEGVFTSEQRENVDNCQILITVPQCLDILMMSSKAFASRLRWIVFDEVHSLMQDNGEVWERNLIACDCPFLALSATIGNSDEFGDWLDKLQRAKNGQECVKIKHQHRFNDLDFAFFDPDSNGGAGGIQQHRSAASLSASVLQKVGFSMKLLPEEAIEYWHRLASLATQVEEDAAGADEGASTLGGWAAAFRRSTPAWLEPADGPTGLVTVTTMDAYELETAVKASLLLLAEEHPEVADSVLEDIADGGRADFERCCVTTDRATLYENTIKCIKSLEGKKDPDPRLPALGFHFSIDGCRTLAEQLCEKLETDQRIFQARTYLRANGMAAEHPVFLQESTPHATLAAMLTDDLWTKVRKWAITTGQFDPDAVDPRFSLGDSKPVSEEELHTMLGKDKVHRAEERRQHFGQRRGGHDLAAEEIAEERDGQNIRDKRARARMIRPPKVHWTKHRKKGDSDVQKKLYQCLQRGIGFHFSALGRKDRAVVEKLFRYRRLGVCFATGTLSLGINMPCPTVILVGTSPFLTTLQFHQMRGRAGRRGFDTRGHTITVGIPAAKCDRLLMQKLPDLAGHGALTPVFVLRQYLRYLKADAAERPAIARAIVRSLKNTLTQGYGKKLQAHFLMLMDFWVRTDALELHTDRPSPAQHGDRGEARCLGCERLSAAAAAANGGGAAAVSATSVRAALRNFEQFHGRAPGTATVDEVEASSAGVAGWAAWKAEGAATTASASCETCRPDNHTGFQATAKCAFLAHLNYLEPQIVCFTDAVYRSDLFLDLAAECIIPGDTFDNDENTDKYEKSRLSKMLELLSIFLFRRPLSPGLDSDAAREATKGACIVELNLDTADNARARAAMADYNACVVDSFASFAQAYNVRARVSGAEDEHDASSLPGGVAAPASHGAPAPAPAAAPVVPPLLGRMSLRTVTRTPFLAMCGRSDRFATVDDLLASTDGAVGFDRCEIPTCLIPGERISAYLVDFFRVSNPGVRKMLDEVHGIKYSQQYDIFYHCNHAIRVIHRALERRVQGLPTDDPRYKLAVVFSRMADEFNGAFKEVFPSWN